MRKGEEKGRKLKGECLLIDKGIGSGARLRRYRERRGRGSGRVERTWKKGGRGLAGSMWQGTVDWNRVVV